MFYANERCNVTLNLWFHRRPFLSKGLRPLATRERNHRRI